MGLVYDAVYTLQSSILSNVCLDAGAWVAGPRIGRFVNGKPVPMPGHNTVFYMCGVLLLWFGFYGVPPGPGCDALLPGWRELGSVGLSWRAGFNPGTMGAILQLNGQPYSEVRSAGSGRDMHSLVPCSLGMGNPSRSVRPGTACSHFMPLLSPRHAGAARSWWRGVRCPPPWGAALGAARACWCTTL